MDLHVVLVDGPEKLIDLCLNRLAGPSIGLNTRACRQSEGSDQATGFEDTEQRTRKHVSVDTRDPGGPCRLISRQKIWVNPTTSEKHA